MPFDLIAQLCEYSATRRSPRKDEMMPWITLGLKLAPLIVGAVHAVERLVKGAKGKEKQDAAVDLIATMLAAIEGAAGKDLLDDAAVQDAVRKTIDAVVSLQNILATRVK